MKDLSRLHQLRDETREVDKEMEQERPRFKGLKESGKPRIVTAFNLFQTPKAIANMMAGHLPPLSSDAVILEPSAGLGRLYSAVRRAGVENKIILNEINADCSQELFNLSVGDSVELFQRDFLEFYCDPVDAVIMNPPFKMGRDIKHIKHALLMVRPGGVLIALCYNGVKQNIHLKPIADHWEVLPSKSFKESGTNAEISLLIIKKLET